MKLEQTIRRSYKGTGGILGQTTQSKYVTELEIVYRKLLSISNAFR